MENKKIDLFRLNIELKILESGIMTSVECKTLKRMSNLLNVPEQEIDEILNPIKNLAQESGKKIAAIITRKLNEHVTEEQINLIVLNFIKEIFGED